MDRAVHMLHGPAPLPGLADLPGLLARFAEAGPFRVQLDLDRALLPVVPSEVGTTVYRVVTEALTNVRRHAPAATTVRTTVRRAPGPAVAVSVVNDWPPGGGQPRSPRGWRSGGFGLAGLRERVHVLGGTLTAGADPDGWRVAASWPIPDDTAAACHDG